MVEAGRQANGRPQRTLSRGRPNWWVILAVSLALMALLAATSAGSRGSDPFRPQSRASETSRVTSPRTTRHAAVTPPAAASTLGIGVPGTTTTTAPPPVSLLKTPTSTTSPPSVTTTVPPSVTTTTVSAAATGTPDTPADRTSNQGLLEPPEDPSNSWGFTGTGAMQVSVSWGNSTYLSMTVNCPNGSQSVGGSSAMAASLPDAQGNCQAVVSEPSSESTQISYTITIGPAGGG